MRNNKSNTVLLIITPPTIKSPGGLKKNIFQIIRPPRDLRNRELKIIRPPRSRFGPAAGEKNWVLRSTISIFTRQNSAFRVSAGENFVRLWGAVYTIYKGDFDNLLKFIGIKVDKLLTFIGIKVNKLSKCF